jgi:hypothetical protein
MHSKLYIKNGDGICAYLRRNITVILHIINIVILNLECTYVYYTIEIRKS